MVNFILGTHNILKIERVGENFIFTYLSSWYQILIKFYLIFD